MKEHFTDLLEQLRRQLIGMGAEVESQIRVAVEALIEGDAAKARGVCERDSVVNDLEVRNEEAVIHLLATQQPVASDLRLLVAAVRINADLERIGDHAVNIAEAAERLAGAKPFKPWIDIPHMAEVVRGMLRDALDAFVRRDPVLAKEVLLRDDIVDAKNLSLIRELLTYMAENPALISRSIEIMSISKNLERVADLATNIAEETIFIAEGLVIKHQGQAPGGAGRAAEAVRPFSPGRRRGSSPSRSFPVRGRRRGPARSSRAAGRRAPPARRGRRPSGPGPSSSRRRPSRPPSSKRRSIFPSTRGEPSSASSRKRTGSSTKRRRAARARATTGWARRRETSRTGLGLSRPRRGAGAAAATASSAEAGGVRAGSRRSSIASWTADAEPHGAGLDLLAAFEGGEVLGGGRPGRRSGSPGPSFSPDRRSGREAVARARSRRASAAAISGCEVDGVGRRRGLCRGRGDGDVGGHDLDEGREVGGRALGEGDRLEEALPDAVGDVTVSSSACASGTRRGRASSAARVSAT